MKKKRTYWMIPCTIALALYVTASPVSAAPVAPKVPTSSFEAKQQVKDDHRSALNEHEVSLTQRQADLLNKLNAEVQKIKAENEAAKNLAIEKAQVGLDLSERPLKPEQQKNEKTERNTNIPLPSIF
ncbi:hypothetical protein KHA96_08185 [Bacillus sp. FJAT-49711]|uniref:hypothetical protein n=1 Tax=Bacillus sp. FJAT-49711 TaxID=2833585 RepID=UPI001BC9C0CA|nr:hypothetical protein [Bacillus sp. FJAT-49711]MBS4218287.1 hypothetical protein [Bacillus sp. FJAT-49711]